MQKNKKKTQHVCKKTKKKPNMFSSETNESIKLIIQATHVSISL